LKGRGWQFGILEQFSNSRALNKIEKSGEGRRCGQFDQHLSWVIRTAFPASMHKLSTGIHHRKWR
jgi:hypothetical protein